MRLFVINFFSLHKQTFCRPMCLHITCIAKTKSGESYPNRVVNFELNRAYMKILTPKSCCTDNTWFFEYFYGFLGFVFWEISGHFGGVYQSRYCVSDGAFLFSFVYVLYLNIAFYLYGKQIKSKVGNKLYLQMIFICVRLNWLDIHECHTMPLKCSSTRNNSSTLSEFCIDTTTVYKHNAIAAGKLKILPGGLNTRFYLWL